MNSQNQNTLDSLSGAQLTAEENAVLSMFATQTYKENNTVFIKNLVM
jgi:hypothetical protein